jgi:YVTN family beta-propeller protein
MMFDCGRGRPEGEDDHDSDAGNDTAGDNGNKMASRTRVNMKTTDRATGQCFVLLLCALSIGCAIAWAAEPAPQAANYVLQKSIPIGGEGRWDYLTVDPASHRLFVPRSTHVQVIDLATDKVQADWPGTSGVHGVALAPERKLAFTSNGRSNNVSVFDLNTNEKLADVKTGAAPDAIAYDPASGKILCMNHRGGTVTLISLGADGKRFTPEQLTPEELQVGGALEFVVTDGDGHAFVNVEDKNEVVEFDTRSPKVLHHWPTGSGEGPTGLAIDVKRRRLFVGCGGNNKMVVMDSTSGNVLATLPIGPRCDGCAFDPGTGDAFAACGDGTVAVVREASEGKFDVVQTVQTKPGARTIAVDPQSHALYLPTAETQATAGATRPTMKPGSFQVLVVAPQP